MTTATGNDSAVRGIAVDQIVASADTQARVAIRDATVIWEADRAQAFRTRSADNFSR